MPANSHSPDRAKLTPIAGWFRVISEPIRFAVPLPPGGVAAAAFPVVTGVQAHSAADGWGQPGESAEGSTAYGWTMSGLILFMVAGLLGALIYFRWRSRNPLPEPDSVESILMTSGFPSPSGPGASPAPDWERPADWWKPDPDPPHPRSEPE